MTSCRGLNLPLSCGKVWVGPSQSFSTHLCYLTLMQTMTTAPPYLLVLSLTAVFLLVMLFSCR